MKKEFLISTIFLIALSSFGQQLPLNTCGIINIYDAAGNRTKRVYFCNNGSDPYPTKTKDVSQPETMDFLPVDALYPNPTNGKFFITFSKALQNADVFLTDENGKAIQHFKTNGNKVNFDLSSVPSGVYFIRIRDGQNIITKKVVKQ